MISGTCRQLLAGISASLGAFSIGQTYAWSSPILELLTTPRSPIPMTKDQGAWVVTSMEYGCFAIPFFAGYLVDKIGRKMTLLLTGPIYALSWTMAYYTDSVYGLYFVRTIQGLCVSTITVVCPMYLGEISETKIRGAIGTLFQISLYSGIVYVYILGTELSYRNYQLANLFISILFMTTFVFMPESPYYYIKNNQECNAYDSLKWFRHKKQEGDIQNEFSFIKHAIQNEKQKSSFKDILHNWTNVRCILLIQGILIIRTFTHIQTLMAYASITFGSGEKFIPPNYISILFGLILLLSILPATYLVDKAGRKILLIISTLGCSIFSLISFLYFYNFEVLKYSVPSYFSLLNFIAICSLGVSYNIGLGPLYTPLTCEYFLSNCRAKCCAILTFSGTTLQFIAYNVFYLLYVHFGMYSNFLVSFIFCILGTLWIKMYIVETKGKTFNEIQELFNNSSNVVSDNNDPNAGNTIAL